MIRVIHFLFLCLILAAWSPVARGQLIGGELQREVVITLDTGEILKGPLIEQTAEYYKIDHVILGEIVIPAVRVSSVVFIKAGAGAEPGPIEPPAEQEPVVLPPDEVMAKSPEPELEVAPKPAPKPSWDGSLEMGVSGSEGNTEMQRGRLVFDAKRKTEHETLDLRLRFQAAQTRGDTSENRFFARAKNEWATSSTDWRVFLEGSAERDQFQDFNWRLTGNSGFAFDAIKGDRTTMTLRAGLGGSTEFGSSRDGVFPEGTLAYELRHRINKNMSLTTNGEVILDFNDTGEYRTRVNAALDTNLDETGAWKLRIGVEDRYETNTTRAKRNDLDYFVSLVYRF